MPCGTEPQSLAVRKGSATLGRSKVSRSVRAVRTLKPNYLDHPFSIAPLGVYLWAVMRTYPLKLRTPHSPVWPELWDLSLALSPCNCTLLLMNCLFYASAPNLACPALKALYCFVQKSTPKGPNEVPVGNNGLLWHSFHLMIEEL